MAKDVYAQLKDTGSVVRGFLGVYPTDIEPDMAEFFGLKDAKGVLISQVTENSAADEAGLKRGDVVTEFDGTGVDNAKRFPHACRHAQAGQRGQSGDPERGQTDGLQRQAGSEAQRGCHRQGRARIAGPPRLHRCRRLTPDVAQRLGYEGLEGVVVTMSSRLPGR